MKKSLSFLIVLVSLSVFVFANCVETKPLIFESEMEMVTDVIDIADVVEFEFTNPEFVNPVDFIVLEVTDIGYTKNNSDSNRENLSLHQFNSSFLIERQMFIYDFSNFGYKISNDYNKNNKRGLYKYII